MDKPTIEVTFNDAHISLDGHNLGRVTIDDFSDSVELYVRAARQLGVSVSAILRSVSEGLEDNQ